MSQRETNLPSQEIIRKENNNFECHVQSSNQITLSNENYAKRAPPPPKETMSGCRNSNKLRISSAQSTNF